MLKIEKLKKDSTLVIKMSGSIEESVNFEELINPISSEMEIYCKEVSRINSIGVKSWIKFFQLCQSKGTKLKFFECSTAIIEQNNLISNFLCNGTVESMYVPFCCENCKTELFGLYQVEDLKKIKMKIPTLKCVKCGGVAIFDDIEEEYFYFLNR